MTPFEPVTVPTEVDNDEPITVPVNVSPTIPPPPAIAASRSDKAYLGLSSTGIPKDDMSSLIQSGKEQELRQRAASTLNFQASMQRENAIVDAFRKKGSSLSYQEALNIVDPFNPDNKPANPLDVLERAYATKYVSSLNTADAYMRDTVLSQAEKEIPEQLEDKRNAGIGIIAKVELAKTLKEDVKTEIGNQGVVPWFFDQAKTMFQPYNEYMMRNLGVDVSTLTSGLGTAMKAQADAILDLPMDVYAPKLKEIVTALRKSNPTLADQFLDYVIGTSENERKLNNVFTIMTPFDIGTVGKLGVGLARKISVNNRAGTAFKQITQQAAKSTDIGVEASMKEASGDIVGAGVNRAAQDFEAVLSGQPLNPVRSIKEDFTSNFRLDGDLLDTNPGKLSRPELVMLKDSFYQAGSKLYDIVLNALKVNRTPVPLASEDALRAYREAERARYPGFDNSLLDVSSPIHMKETNTYWIAHTFGNLQGRLFSDPETAINFAKERLQFADARIGSTTGTVEKEPGKLVGSVTDLRRQKQIEQSLPLAEKALDKAQTFAGRKFIGPRTPESVAKAKEDIDFFKTTIDKYKSDLAEINKRITPTDPVIEQNGVGYNITILRPYRENDEVVRSWLINDNKAKSTSSAAGWESWRNSFLGWVRGADDTLAYNESLNRKIANYTQTVLRTWAKDEARAIEDIGGGKWYKPQTWYRAIGNKQMFKEFNDFLKFAKTDRDPTTKELGYFKKTPGEIDDHYQRFYQRPVTLPEVKAYFAHVKLLEGNRILSEIAEFRNRARLGTEQHQVFTLSKDGTRIGSEYFDGIEMKEFPGGKEDQILIMGGHKGDEKLYHLGANEIPGQEHKRYRELVETGRAKVIRIYDPDSHPLEGFLDVAGGKRIRYVVVTDSETKPLGFNHVNRRGGGHFDVDSDWYVKQASMVSEEAGSALNDKRRLIKKTYTGDSTFMPISNRIVGRDVVTKMNRMNELMKTNQIDAAKELSKKLGIDWEVMEGYYKPKRAPNGHVIGKPSLDWDEPFYVVPRNKTIYDLNKDLEKRHGDLWRDGTRSGSDARQFHVDYNQARDSENLMTLKNEGTHADPIYKHVPADYVDPIPSLNRALNRAISSTFMDDYKIHAIEHWLAEATPHFKASETEVRAAPFFHFNNADRGAFKSATETDNPGVIDNLLSNRFKIRQFVGLPNKLDTYVHGMSQLLIDEFYKRGTPEWFQAVPLWALSKVTNASALRSFAFNAKLGLFSIPQFFVQAQTFTNIWAISPRSAAGGSLATMLHTWSRINRHPEVLDAMDKMATKLSFFGNEWKPGWFKEANSEFARTGFEHVGGEHILSDDQMQHKFIKNQWGNFLDAGQVFFKEGERSTRIGAYYTSFLEWRTANPTKVLTDTVRGEILNKADLLTNNMSRASASSLNSSLLSLPTQFLSYQIRLAELFLGKRLGGTTAERAMARGRLLGFYAAMYGAPSAIGVTGYPDGGFPMIPSLREYAINHGYVTGTNKFEDIVMNGIPAWTLAMVSGGLDYEKGNQYNFGNRYGSQGLTVLQQSMKSDTTVWKLATGAAGSVFGNTITSFDPFWQMAKHLVTNDEEGNVFKITPNHLEGMFSEISSVDSAKRLIYALHTGRWLSHNESFIENVTGLDALYRTMTGLRSQEQDDIFTLKNIKDQEERVQKEAEREIIKDYHRGIQAATDKDDASAKTYFTNARARMIASGIPLDRRAEIMANASRNYEPQIETSVRNWATKNVPFGENATRLDAYTRFMQRQDSRK